MASYIYVLLAGRAGNQLFQIAAGEYSLFHSASPGRKLGFIVSKDTPKTFLEIQQSVVRVSVLTSKLLNYLLSRGVQKQSKRWPILFRAVKLVCKCSLAIELRTLKIDLRVARSVNATPDFNKLKQRITVYVGYFQNYYWQSLESHMQKQMSKYVKSSSAQMMPKSISNRNSVVVHLRRTDYAFNPELGLLSDEFYQSALDYVSELIGPPDIHILTDDKEFEAQDFVKKSLVHAVFTPEKMSDLESFEFMRRASNLLISNSSFAWWAAYLQYGQYPERLVLFPYPWFRTTEGLRDFPQSWIGIQSFWTDNL